MTIEKSSDPAGGPITLMLRVLVDVKPGETAALAWSWLYFFSILSAYYVIRPIRDEIGAAGGIENLPWLFTILSTFLYFQQADIAKQTFTSRAARTAFFAKIDLTVNVLTLLTQLLLTGRIIKRLGVALTLTLLPLLSVAGFAVLGLAPTLWAVITFQVLRRAGNFAVARPTRETCFTVVPREDKYKAKSFIDTFVYRAGDQIGAWSYAGLGFIGLGLAGISLAAVPISIAWLVNGLWLGRRNEALAREAAHAASARPPG